MLSFGRKKRTDVFPYTYRYSVSINCDDKHVGTDGWSHSCNLHDPENRAMTIAGLSFLQISVPTPIEIVCFFYVKNFLGRWKAGYYNL